MESTSKKKQINVFQNNEYILSYSGSQQYGQGFTDSDFYINNTVLNFSFPFLYSSKTQYTLIYKYKLVSYSNGVLIPNRSGFGSQINLVESGTFGVWNMIGGGRWFRDGGPFGHTAGSQHEIAVECTSSRMKIWMDGVLKKNYSNSWSIDTWLRFGDTTNKLRMYINDILVTDALFLPNNYTVDWNDTWYEIHHKQVYNHTNESFWIPK